MLVTTRAAFADILGAMTLRATWIAMTMTTAACAAADDDATSVGETAGSEHAGSEAGTTAAETASSSPADTSGSDSGGMPDGADAMEFFAHIPGLWAGPLDSTTSVGDFPTMNMDVRAADGHTLFCRTDIDGGNNLRFAFAIEDHDGPTLVFRNGGYFLGILRDSRTVLAEADLAAERWRFCSLEMGCDYISAVFDFEGEDHLDMHVDVRGMTHFDWPATREELRELDGPFPVDDVPLPGDQDFPAMPTLNASLTWSTPLPADTDAWIILSTGNCPSCTPSRFIHGTATAGSTSLELVLEQIHAGDYKANAILDRNNNLAGTFFPDSGDTVSIPNMALTIDATGTTEISVPLLVDI